MAGSVPLKPAQARLCKLSLAFEEALLRERIKFVRELKEKLKQDGPEARMVAALTELIDDLIYDVALEVHRAVKTGVDTLADVRQRLAEGSAGASQAPVLIPPMQPVVVKGNMVDVFGNVIPPIALDQVTCPSCRRKVAAGRFAPHLEKCMGRGRQASRQANKRLSAMELG